MNLKGYLMDEDKEYVEESDHVYLRDLAERLRSIPAMYGTDGGDVDRVLEIAKKLKTYG